MGKAVKSVKKFAQKHLGATIARRRKLKPMNNALRKKKAGQLMAGDDGYPLLQMTVLRSVRIMMMFRSCEIQDLARCS